MRRRRARATKAHKAPITIASAEIGRTRQLVVKSPSLPAGAGSKADWVSNAEERDELFRVKGVPLRADQRRLARFLRFFLREAVRRRGGSNNAPIASTRARPLERNSMMRFSTTCSRSFSPRGRS